MNLKDLKKPLEVSEIDFRIQSINKGGYATILAYKDARVDMNRLDDVCGADNWHRAHKEVHNVVYCGIGIDIEIDPDSGNYKTVWKWDAGSESFTEKEKGEASDSFKRAGFNWGIGRELYDYPQIQVKLNADEFEVKTVKINGKDVEKAFATWNLKLKQWRWYSKFEDGELTILAAKDQNDKVRFDWRKPVESK